MESRPTPDHGLVGSHIGKYVIVDEVGFGGMSVVYLAHDNVLDREVAIKVLHPHLAKRADARKRFSREAKAVAKVHHRNILEIYDYSADQSQQAYIVTEFVKGPTVRDLIEDRGVAFPEIGAMICVQLADALAHAHEFGVVHRDVKPENAMVRVDGLVKLMDFGIAHVLENQTMTQTGTLLGSPSHMAPEVVNGEKPDLRSDIFSLGTILYYTSTGQLPFQGRNTAVILRNIVESKYLDPEIQDPRIGQGLGRVIRKCLEREPDDRYQTAGEVADALRVCLEEVGLVDVVAELSHFLNDDDQTFRAALQERIITALEEVGRVSLEHKEVAKAVDAFNRVLALDDDHEGVRQLLGRLDRRRQLAGYGIFAGVVLAVIAGAVLITSLVSRDQTVDLPLIDEAVLEARQQVREVLDGSWELTQVKVETQQESRLAALDSLALASGVAGGIAEIRQAQSDAARVAAGVAQRLTDVGDGVLLLALDRPDPEEERSEARAREREEAERERLRLAAEEAARAAENDEIPALPQAVAVRLDVSPGNVEGWLGNDNIGDPPMWRSQPVDFGIGRHAIQYRGRGVAPCSQELVITEEQLIAQEIVLAEPVRCNYLPAILLFEGWDGEVMDEYGILGPTNRNTTIQPPNNVQNGVWEVDLLVVRRGDHGDPFVYRADVRAGSELTVPLGP